MRVLKLLKIPYTALLDLLLHLKIIQKLPLHPKTHHLRNLLSIILLHMVILQSLLLTLLLKINQLNKLFIIILLHMVILESLLLTLPLLKIHQLNKLLNIILLHMFIL
jgi:hypothetical protein